MARTLLFSTQAPLVVPTEPQMPHPPVPSHPTRPPDARPWRLHEQVVLFRIGSWTVVSFGAFAALGGALASWVVLARQHQIGLPAAELRWWLVLMAPFLALVGSRLYALVVMEWRDLLADPAGTLPRTTLAWQGGFLAVTAGVLVLASSHGIDWRSWIDCFALGVPLGQAFGRLGCHTYGCCHGRPTRGWPAITVHNPLSKVHWGSGLGGVPLHPVQLYSAAANLALAALLAVLAQSGLLQAGTIAATYLVLDGAKRMGLEWFRGIPVERWLGLTPFQVFALLQMGVGAWVAGQRDPAVLVDFGADTLDAMAHAAAWWPACVVAGLGMLGWMGIHRGDPGSMRLRD